MSIHLSTKNKNIISFLTGAIISFISTVIIISNTENILTDEQYREYKTLNDKNNQVVAYRNYYYDSARLIKYLNEQYFYGNIDKYVEPSLKRAITGDCELIKVVDNDSSQTSNTITIR